MKRFHHLLVTALLLVLVSVFTACDSNPTGSDGSAMKTTILGRVLDEQGQAIPGATVRGHGATATTDANGIFTLSNVSVPEERCFITCSASGYFNGAGAARPRLNAATPIEVTLARSTVVATVSASSPGIVTIASGSQVELPADGFRLENGSSYSGQVQVLARRLDPDSEDFSRLFPGDILAQRSDNTETTLLSYGVLIVELRDPSGRKLVLTPGRTATLSFPIPASMRSSAPSSIPLWYFDELIGKWKEEGSAVRQGDTYVGDVSHFTPWNCDVAMREPCRLHLQVVTPDGKPLGGIKVRTGQVINTTDGAGHLWTYGTTNATIYVDPKLNGGLGSDPFEVICTEGGLIERTIVINAAAATGRLADCEGRAAAGLIFARWSGGPAFSTAVFGEFSIAVPAGAEVTIYATGGDRSASVGPLASGASGSAGVIKVCSGGSWTSRRPGVGSLYTFRTNALDSNGFVVPGQGVTDRYQVVRTDVAMNNRTDVVLFVLDNDDSLFIHYEGNGDFTVLGERGLDLTFPVASRVPQTIPLQEIARGPGSFDRASGLITYEGSEELKVQGTTMNAHRGRLILNEISFVDNQPDDSIRVDITYWYVPQIGFFAKFESYAEYEGSGSSSRVGIRRELESYTLR